ncbi:hypothetical protein ZHAS_00021434 [Anopheles sinensis]|uniref:Uncharacterized protein n=1 Tax=Anopheles sinensis TaxID=74873 RepID=A0A084WSC9_ANOSI|nr:hypothetical protein ZHAS_00021434 [Anopheles sinensis]
MFRVWHNKEDIFKYAYIVAIDLIVQHIREFLNNRTRSDHSPHLATCGTNALNLAAGRGKPSINDSEQHYRPH